MVTFAGTRSTEGFEVTDASALGVRLGEFQEGVIVGGTGAEWAVEDGVRSSSVSATMPAGAKRLMAIDGVEVDPEVEDPNVEQSDAGDPTDTLTVAVPNGEGHVVTVGYTTESGWINADALLIP